MKTQINKYWEMFKAAFSFIIIIWAMVLLTLVILRVTSTEVLANADVGYWTVVIGAIITFLAVPIHHWFKNK